MAPLQYYWPINGLGDSGSYLHRNAWQVNTKGGPTKHVRQNAILGGLSIGQFPWYRHRGDHLPAWSHHPHNLGHSSGTFEYTLQSALSYQHWVALALTQSTRRKNYTRVDDTCISHTFFNRTLFIVKYSGNIF